MEKYLNDMSWVNDMDAELNKLRKIYKLKRVERWNSVGKRKESSAEHSWSAIVLADYFLSKSRRKLDRLKVYELLLYHDLVEIETGDVPIQHEDKRIDKHWNEQEAAKKLKKALPTAINSKFAELFREFEEMKTPEAKYAKAIDKLDATLHEMDNKKDWKGWTEEQTRRYNSRYLKDFPELMQASEKMIAYAKRKGFYSQ